MNTQDKTSLYRIHSLSPSVYTSSVERQRSAPQCWEAIETEEAEWGQVDQTAAIRPELSAAWTKLKAALGEFAYDLAVAFDRASIQLRRSDVVRTLCGSVATAMDRASMRLSNG